VARDYRITQIVLGETRRSRWQLLLRGSLTYRLMNLLTEQSVDLHIMSHDSRAPRSQNSAES